MSEYNFACLKDVLTAISALSDDRKAEFNQKMKQIEPAAKAFLKARTNSQLLDMADEEVTIDKDILSIYDYMGSALEWYEEETDSRNWPTDADVAKAARKWDPNWSGEDDYLLDRFLELEKQTKGIQKKLDKVIKLLEGTKVTMSVEDALKL